MTRIDAALDPFHAAMQGRHDAAANTPSGWLQGQRIAPAPTGISLTDAAEELSLHMAQAAEEKHHSERKVTAERPMLWLDAAQLAELFSHAHDPDAQAKLEALTAELLRGRGAPMQLAAQAFPGVTQQYLALQHALRRGEHEDAAPHALEALRDALADLELAHGPEIRAGINTLPAAGAFARSPDELAGFQHTYRDIALGQLSLARTLDMVLERYGNDDIHGALGALTQALGHDLAAATPSTDGLRLQVLVSDLYQVEVAATVLEECNALKQRLGNACAQQCMDAQGLMRDLVGISEDKWIAPSRFEKLAERHGANALSERIAFLAGVRQILKDLPTQIYADMDVRTTILAAAQDALDNAIAMENT